MRARRQQISMAYPSTAFEPTGRYDFIFDGITTTYEDTVPRRSYLWRRDFFRMNVDDGHASINEGETEERG